MLHIQRVTQRVIMNFPNLVGLKKDIFTSVWT